MLRHIDKTTDSGSILHLATHFANLVKVSETITVRKAAGNGLLSIIEKMPLEQRNELTVELFNGLEIGDYQFSKYMPDFLGIIMPYTAPGFIAGGSDAAVYAYSLACLENARDILRALEDEYQATYEKKLTLKRLGEVITYPRRPITGTGVSYDENLAPSVYVQNEINKMKRLKRLMMKGRK